MKHLAPLAIAAIIPFALITGCATSGATVVLDSTKAFTAAEAAYDAAVQSADIAINTGNLKPPTVARIKALADTGHTYVVLGRRALVAADASSLGVDTTALSSIVAEIAALAKG